MTVDDSAPSFSVRDLPPVPWVRERDVDLLLARLFATQPPLIEWFTSRAMAPDRSLPTGDPVEVHAAINFHRHSAEGHATGETDVLVEATYAGGTLLMSIENKTWAAPQDRQGERHVAFVRASGRAWCLAAVVAPKFWLDSHDTEVRVYDIAVPLEELAGWCGDQPVNLGFCSSVFDQACKPPVVDFAPDLQEWNTRINEILVEHHQLQLAPTQHTRTKSIGQARPGRYISCASDTLPFVPGVGRPWLRLKTSSANYDARADIELEGPTRTRRRDPSGGRKRRIRGEDQAEGHADRHELRRRGVGLDHGPL